jgi:hypothetical protein
MASLPIAPAVAFPETQGLTLPGAQTSSDVWCHSEITSDEDDPFIQHIALTAYVNADDAHMHLDSETLRTLEEDRRGIKIGRATVARYCMTIDDLVRHDDNEVSMIAGVIQANPELSGKSSLGLIVTKTLSVSPVMRGNRVCRRMLQELRRLHCGIPFHYGHSAVPQERASLDNNFIARMERLTRTYLDAGIDLEVPNPDLFPEIMTAYWQGDRSAITPCTISWKHSDWRECAYVA